MKQKLECKTQWHILVAHLWRLGTWQPTHLLQSTGTQFGFIGSSGEQRVRELARNAPSIPEELRDKIEKKRGSEIGLDPRYEFFRYKSKPSRMDYVVAAREMCRRFDAGLAAEYVFAV